jgi:hypothetical protein
LNELDDIVDLLRRPRQAGNVFVVDCASIAAALTTSVARTNWLLISAIDADNSFAAAAAARTLPNASLEV